MPRIEPQSRKKEAQGGRSSGHDQTTWKDVSMEKEVPSRRDREDWTTPGAHTANAPFMERDVSSQRAHCGSGGSDDEGKEDNDSDEENDKDENSIAKAKAQLQADDNNRSLSDCAESPPHQYDDTLSFDDVGKEALFLPSPEKQSHDDAIPSSTDHNSNVSREPLDDTHPLDTDFLDSIANEQVLDMESRHADGQGLTIGEVVGLDPIEDRTALPVAAAAAASAAGGNRPDETNGRASIAGTSVDQSRNHTEGNTYDSSEDDRKPAALTRVTPEPSYQVGQERKPSRRSKRARAPTVSYAEQTDEHKQTGGRKAPAAKRRPSRKKSKAKEPSRKTESASTHPAAPAAVFAPSAEALALCPSDRKKQALKTWYMRLSELNQYKSEYGHTNVPQQYPENPKLGTWVNKMRCQRETLSQDKVGVLDSIGFNWGTKKGQRAWEIRFAQLEQYKEENGHCNVPTKYEANPALGRWVSSQRSKYKKKQEGQEGTIEDDQVKRLEEIGFSWKMN